MPSIAIIGAGLSGLTLAHELQGKVDIDIFEKSRGASGRMATRTENEWQFDHGAQYFTVHSTAFKTFLQPYLAAGLLKAWKPQLVSMAKGRSHEKLEWIDPHYTFVPKMNAFGHALAQDLNVQLNTRVEALEKNGDAWRLKTANATHGPYDWVVSTAPAPQTRALMPPSFCGNRELDKVQMQGCFSLMLGLPDEFNAPWQAARVEDSCIGWMALDSSKPGRSGPTTLLVQANNRWSQERIDHSQESIKTDLIEELQRLLHFDFNKVLHSDLHRWRYANTPQPAGTHYLMDQNLRLAACGDWCIEGRIEGAFNSGYRLAKALRNLL